MIPFLEKKPSLLGKYETSKGLCLILSYTNFSEAKYEMKEDREKRIAENPNSQVENQEWANLPSNAIDVTKLTETFQKFKFEVVAPLEDETKSKTKEWLATQRDKIKVGNYNCLVVAITSHGDDGVFLCTDEGFETPDLFEMFNEVECPKLRGKLKMFIIDTCQGKEANSGTEAISKGQHKFVRIPHYSDYLYYFANYPGFVAANRKTGSVLTHRLCKVLKKHYQEHDLVTMLTFTNLKVSKKLYKLMPDYKPAMQMPYFRSTLKRLVYFTSSHPKNDIFTKWGKRLRKVAIGKSSTEMGTSEAENTSLGAALGAALGESREIHVQGVDEKTVEVLITLVKGEATTDFTLDNAPKILVIAHKLKLMPINKQAIIKTIKDRCQYFLQYNPEYLSEKTAIDVLLFAHQYDAVILKMTAMKKINESKTIRHGDEFNQIVEDNTLFKELCLSG